jgi:hypothetical protein
MQRRQFLTAAAMSAILGRVARAESLPCDLKITRIISFAPHTRRSKFAEKNTSRSNS